MWLFLIILFFFFYFLRGAYKSYRKLTGQDDDTLYYDGPGMTNEQLEAHVRRFPKGYVAETSPEIVETIRKKDKALELSKIYREAVEAYQKGDISKRQLKEIIDSLDDHLDISFLDTSK